MSKKRNLKDLLRYGGTAKIKDLRVPRAAYEPPQPPALTVDAKTIEALVEEARASKNVIDLPLSGLTIPPYHGDRNPYSEQGKWRADALRAHIRSSGGWNSHQCEVLTVSLRKDGSYVVIDGVGRVFMAHQLSGGVVTHLSCRILTGLTYAQEVELFRRLGQARNKITPRDAWLAQRGMRGHEEVGEIMTIVERWGARMPKATLSMLRFGYSRKFPKTGEPVLETAIAIVANTSLGLNHKLSSTMIGAIVAVLSANPVVDTDRLRHVCQPEGNDKLSVQWYDRVCAKAGDLGYRKPQQRTVTWLLARHISQVYNHSFRGDKLSETALEFETDFIDAYSCSPPKVVGRPAKLKAVA